MFPKPTGPRYLKFCENFQLLQSPENKFHSSPAVFCKNCEPSKDHFAEVKMGGPNWFYRVDWKNCKISNDL